jgi:biopolymer transport protein ExbB
MKDSSIFPRFLLDMDGVGLVILSLLVLSSVISWSVMATKLFSMLKMKRLSQRFLDEFRKNPHLDAVLETLQKKGESEPFSQLVRKGLMVLESNYLLLNSPLVNHDTHARLHASLTRSFRYVMEESKGKLEFGLTSLATIASSAPFLGLLGTVWGIYHALLAIGLSGQSGLDKVAAPVGEALIMTAIGLAVAIPAAIGYNSFVRLSRNTMMQISLFTYELHDFFLSEKQQSSFIKTIFKSTQKVKENDMEESVL